MVYPAQHELDLLLVKTLLREWAYRFAYAPKRPPRASAARPTPLVQPPPTTRLAGGHPPISRVSQVCGSHS